MAAITSTPQSTTPASQSAPQTSGKNTPPSAKDRKFYNCGKPGHIALKCPKTKKESTGRPATPARTKQVCSQGKSQTTPPTANPTPESLLLLSSSEDESTPHANRVYVADQGSVTQCVKLLTQGVPAYGLIDSGADTTIIEGSLFKKVATIARLKKKNFMKADKVPWTYDQKPFSLDGQMDLEFFFGDKQMTTPIYIKMDRITNYFCLKVCAVNWVSSSTTQM